MEWSLHGKHDADSWPVVLGNEDWSRVHGPGDDEEEFGGNHAERTGGHACAVGRSLAVHFSYAPLPG